MRAIRVFGLGAIFVGAVLGTGCVEYTAQDGATWLCEPIQNVNGLDGNYKAFLASQGYHVCMRPLEGGGLDIKVVNERF